MYDYKQDIRILVAEVSVISKEGGEANEKTEEYIGSQYMHVIWYMHME